MSNEPNLGQTPHAGEADRRWTYLAVAAVELVVIFALWAFGRYFGSL